MSSLCEPVHRYLALALTAPPFLPISWAFVHSDGIQKKGGSSWVAGTVYLSHTVGTAGAPLPLSQQAFVQLRWRDREATHKPHNVEDDTFYFYLKMSDAAEILPEIAYAGMQPKDRAVLNGLQALLPPLPPHEAIWGKELLANRSPSGVEPKER